jgi:hypothetical protein
VPQRKRRLRGDTVICWERPILDPCGGSGFRESSLFRDYLRGLRICMVKNKLLVMGLYFRGGAIPIQENLT